MMLPTKLNSNPFRLTAFLIVLLLVGLSCGDLMSVDTSDLQDQDLSGRSFTYSKLSGLDLSGKNFQRADFSGSILYNTDLSDTNLRDANFYTSDLVGAVFHNSDLSGANLDRANMIDADFTNAILDEKWSRILGLLTSGEGAGVDYRGYDLSNAYMAGFNLTKANFRKASFNGAYLVGANFKYADLSFADLRNTELASTDFTGANLTSTSFQNSNFNHTNLNYANLTGIDFSELVLKYVNMKGAIIDPHQLDTAIFWCTLMPDGVVAGEDHCFTTPETWSPDP